MGKKGSGNPMEAYRKAAKARELKKNKAQRKENREVKAVWRDTRDLEAEIAQLKNSKLNEDSEKRLATLEAELKYVGKLKKKYVEAHPDAKDKVYHTEERRPRQEREDGGDGRPDPMAHLYNPDGTLRDPKRSVYYDAVYNPFGVPPPGMPYAERPRSEASESSDEDEDSDDSDIVMPEGPRPDEDEDDSDGDSDDSDDIPLPAGPPPPRPVAVRPPPFRPPGMPMRPPRGPGGPGGPPGGAGWGHLMPGAQQPGPRPPRPPVRLPGSLPVRPSGLPPRPPSLPAKPGTAPAGAAGPNVPTAAGSVTAAPARPAGPPPAAATISAEPQLRDLRKETTVFVPRAARRKAGPGGVTVNATPGAGVVDAEGDAVRVRAAPRPGLMDKLAGVLGDNESGTKKDQTEDEYERFLAGL